MMPVLWKGKNGRWNPFRDLETIQEEMNKFFNGPLERWVGGDGGSLEASLNPAIDVIDSKNDVRVLAEVPGLNKDDIHVEVDGNTLTIKTEKKQESETKENGFVRSERMYGTFYRALSLPQGLDTTNIKANYKNGVLELTLPKKEEAKPKQITVNVN